jgi:hypothetical protein
MDESGSSGRTCPESGGSGHPEVADVSISIFGDPRRTNYLQASRNKMFSGKPASALCFASGELSCIEVRLTLLVFEA